MNLLWDSARKCIDIAERFSQSQGCKGWRKSTLWRREIKNIFRKSERINRSGGNNKAERLRVVVKEYLELCKRLEVKVSTLLVETSSLKEIKAMLKHLELVYYHQMLVKHIDLVQRRLINGEVIEQSEKIYSIFETHSEWLSKGKKFQPVEIGHNVLIATDQFDFIIDHQVVEKQTDVELTKSLASRLVKKYRNIESLSFDKGFYSKENKEFVGQIIPTPIMPKKGKRTKEETLEEYSDEFIKLRYAHNAVESNIHQLEHNGMGRCPDKGIDHFKRYTALSMLAYNIHKLAEHIEKKERRKKERKKAT